MNPVQGRPKTKLVLIIVGVFAALVILGGVVYAVILAGTQKTDTNTNNQPAPTRSVVTDEMLKQGAEKLSETVEKEKAQREKAQQAMNDHLKRTDLSK